MGWPRCAGSCPADPLRPNAPPWRSRIFWKEKSLMFRKHTLALFLTVALAACAAWAQDRRSRIDVQQYTIDAEVSPSAQSLNAKASVRFLPLDDNITSVNFELNNALNVARVVDDTGKQIQASRNQQDFSVRLSFDQPLVKGQSVTVTFYYDGKLSGQED